jgi:hypothetical protein
MTPNRLNVQDSSDLPPRPLSGKPRTRPPKNGLVVSRLEFGLRVLAVIVLTGIGSLATASCSQQSSTISTGTPTATLAPSPQKSATVANYNKLQTGMSYSEVVELLGPPDREIKSRETNGAYAVTCTWGGDQLGSINVVFQDDRLVQKSQYGLQ